jgi:hypothetical protein
MEQRNIKELRAECFDLRERNWRETGEDSIRRELHNLYASSNIIRVMGEPYGRGV